MYKLRPGPAILLLLPFALLLAACGSSSSQKDPSPTAEPSSPQAASTSTVPRATVSALLTALPTAGINITYPEYTAALGKWRAAGVTEYEMDIDVGFLEVPEIVPSGGYKVRVSAGGENVTLLQAPQLPDGSEYVLKPSDKAAARYLTVEGQFENIAELLSKPSITGSSVLVKFDPTLGYPVSVENENVVPAGAASPGGNGGRVIQVHSLIITRRTTLTP